MRKVETLMNSPAASNTSHATRTAILDATEQIMLDEGYAGVSSRKVATRAGLKSKLLHYYFRTMDDLFIAAFERRENWHLANFASALASPMPLHAIWNLGVDAAASRLNLEFNALACHRPLVRNVIARSATRDRISVAAALQGVMQRKGFDLERYPPKVVALTMAGIARALATERALGADDGHAEAIAHIDGLLAELEPAPTPENR